MTRSQRAPRIDVVQGRNDREIIRPFVSQLGAWRARLAKLDALIARMERKSEDPSQAIGELRVMRADVAARLAEFDKSICGRPASSTVATTRQVFVRLMDLIDVTIGRFGRFETHPR